MAFFLSIYVFGILGFFIHVFSLPVEQRTKPRIIELLLLYQLVFSVGFTSFVAFFGLTFLDQYVADLTGWPACPFEQQLANVNLAFGFLGVLSIWYRNNFWIATVLGFSIWILSDGIQHLFHYFVRGNDTAGNIGVPLWTDILVPIFLLILLFLYRRENSQSQS